MDRAVVLITVFCICVPGSEAARGSFLCMHVSKGCTMVLQLLVGKARACFVRHARVCVVRSPCPMVLFIAKIERRFHFHLAGLACVSFAASPEGAGGLHHLR